MGSEATPNRAGTVRLGNDLTVGRLGYGAMRLTGPNAWNDPPDRDAAITLLHRAVDLGVTFIDTADAYGPHTNETLIRDALYPYPDDLVIATKGGVLRYGPALSDLSCVGTRPYLRYAAQMSARRLNVDTIDLYYLHGVDSDVPFEDQVGTLHELRQDGIIRTIGLSNVTVDQFEMACHITEIASVTAAYNVENQRAEPLRAAAAQVGTVFSPFSPLAAKKGYGNWAPDMPVPIDHRLAEIADRHGVTPGQIMLAWLVQRSPLILPIPGTTSAAHLEENVSAASITLSEAEVLTLDTLH